MNPYANTHLAAFLKNRILELSKKKKQNQIATEAGFRNPNMIAMIKAGASKLPLDRVLSLAKALECDPALLLRLALEQACGVTAAHALIDVFGEPATANERDWLEVIRQESAKPDPRITEEAKVAVAKIFGG
ncbi:XRE family transcriptional regulator [Sulfitobacter mediterraneus]|uniref:XRE family transcriptional regulator n=1 Tax=Sulfitobacter mediterraneus TaxID=83219 RepID=UPI00248F64A5|nr:XRE family transcriptional regulator [Sulfitobacter mediterraneus]